MQNETRIERRLDRLIAHAQSPRSAAVVIATITTATTLVAGVLMTLTDEESFPSIGSGMWWAVQTVTTVGYGDQVPQSSEGRLLASLVMLLGIGFITVITASITGAFVARSRRESSDARAAVANATSAEDLKAIIERLDRIEAALRDPK